MEAYDRFHRLTGARPVAFVTAGSSHSQHPPREPDDDDEDSSAAFYRAVISQGGQPEPPTHSSSTPPPLCDVCEAPILSDDHHASTVHRLATERPPPPPPTYAFSERDKAYRMMETMGWTHGRGLGREASGRKAPLKATKRAPRAALGHPAAVPKQQTSETKEDVRTQKTPLSRAQRIALDEKERNRRRRLLAYLNSD